MLLLIAVGCHLQGKPEGCERTLASVSDAPAPVDVATVQNEIEDYSPSQVAWYASPTDGASSVLSLGITPHGDASTAAYVGNCTPSYGLALFVPVTYDLDLDEGGAVSSFEGGIEAWGVGDEFTAFSFAAGSGGEAPVAIGSVTLSDDWLASAAADTGQDFATVTSWSVILQGSLAAGYVSIVGDRGGGGTSVYWDGSIPR